MIERRTFSEMAEMLTAMADMKARWIEDHEAGKDSRPEWVIKVNRRDLSVLRQAADDYKKAAERAG